MCPWSRGAVGSPVACHSQAGGRDSDGISKQFDRLYSEVDRPSIPPERLLRALLLQVFYTIRSERSLMEELDYNLLYRWLVGLEIDNRVWDVTVNTKNRDRLLDQEVAQSFFEQVKQQVAELMSDEHFTVDGTLIEAWASHKSFQRKGRGDGGQKSAMRFAIRDYVRKGLHLPNGKKQQR
jgi:transposase